MKIAFVVVALVYRLPLILLMLLVYSIVCRSEHKQRRHAPALCKALLRAIPSQRQAALNFGRLLGDIAYLLGAQKHVITSNLTIAFGNTYSAEKQLQLVRDTYRFLGASLLDWLLIGRINGAQLRAMIDFVPTAATEQFVQDARAQGCILLGMHSANLYLTYIVDDMLREQSDKFVYAFAREQPPLGEALKNIVLSRTNLHMVSKRHNSAARLLKALQQGHSVSLIADVDDASRSRFQPFFDEQASVVPGVYRFAQRQRCPVYATACYLDADHSYKVELQKIDYDAQGNDEQVAQQLVSGYFAFVERIVRAHPEQYQWMHKRWRARPTGDTRDLYARP